MPVPSYSRVTSRRARLQGFNADPTTLYENGTVPSGLYTYMRVPYLARTCGTTAASATVTCADTTGIKIGSAVSGTGVTTARSVTFQDTGDTVTLNNHGLPNGTRVMFTAIASTTGIAINTPYYVITTLTNTFQVAATPGGSAIALTTNGTGTLVYNSFVVAITTNTNFTLDVPASATNASVRLNVMDLPIPFDFA